MRSERRNGAGGAPAGGAGDAAAFAASVELLIQRLRTTANPAAACRQAREDVSLRLDGHLSEVGAARLRAHLDACARCRSYRAQLELLTRMLRTAPLVEPSLPFAPRCAPVRPRYRALHRPRVWPAAAVAAAALVVATLVDLGASSHGEGQVAGSGTALRLTLKERQLLVLDGVRLPAAPPMPGSGVRRPVQAAEVAAGADAGVDVM